MERTVYIPGLDPRYSAEQLVRDLLSKAIDDGLVAPADSFLDSDPQCRTAGELVGVAEMLMRYETRPRNPCDKPHDFKAFNALCRERGTLTLRLGFDADSEPYLYDEETGRIVEKQLCEPLEIHMPPKKEGFTVVSIHVDERIK